MSFFRRSEGLLPQWVRRRAGKLATVDDSRRQATNVIGIKSRAAENLKSEALTQELNPQVSTSRHFFLGAYGQTTSMQRRTPPSNERLKHGRARKRTDHSNGWMSPRRRVESRSGIISELSRSPFQARN